MYSIYPSCQEETFRAGGGGWTGTYIIHSFTEQSVFLPIPFNDWTLEVLADDDLQLNQAVMISKFSPTESGCSHRDYQMQGITTTCNARCMWVMPM